jgi:hypothetical protein
MVIDNCAPYDVVSARNKILGVLEFEPEECIPMTEDSISAIISEIHQKFPKVPKKQFTRDKIEQKAKLQVPNEYKKGTLTFCLNTKKQSVLINLIWAKQVITHTKFISRTMNQFIANNLKFLKHTKASLRPRSMNGLN